MKMTHLAKKVTEVTAVTHNFHSAMEKNVKIFLCAYIIFFKTFFMYFYCNLCNLVENQYSYRLHLKCNLAVTCNLIKSI